MKIQSMLPFFAFNEELKYISFLSLIFNVEFLINLILIVFLFNFIKLLLHFNKIIIKNITKSTNSYFVSIPASFVYFLPFYQLNFMYYNEIKKINFLRYNFLRLLSSGIKSNVTADIYTFKKIIMLLSEYSPLFLLIFAYFFVIKEKINKTNYFIRFHTMHAILILLLQLPVMVLRKHSSAFYVTNPQLKFLIVTFTDTILIFNLYFLLYSAFCAINNSYTNIPFITSACEAHIGKRVDIK